MVPVVLVLVAVGVVALVLRLGQRAAERNRLQRQQEAAPIPGLAEYAASQGWAGPSADPAFDTATARYVTEMLRNLHGVPRDGDVHVSGPRFTDVYSGQAGGRPFVLGNAWIGVQRTGQPGSVCVLRLGQALPPLFVNLRRYRPAMHLFLKDITFESEQFNRQFQVLALNREYATAVITERTMALLLQRDDWVFFLELDRLVCVCNSGLQSVQEYAARLNAVAQFAALVPAFVQQDRGARFPTLPDGTTLDPLDPSSRDKFKEALQAMPPGQRAEFLAQVQAEGLQFVAGMLGRELAPGLAEEFARRLRSSREGPAPFST